VLNSQVKKIPSQLRLKYFTLLCQHRPDYAYNALISFDFPLDECLELAEKFKVPDSLAYLKHKLGRVKDSISEFKKVDIFLT
jgi:hypothetical protein